MAGRGCLCGANPWLRGSWKLGGGGEVCEGV